MKACCQRLMLTLCILLSFSSMALDNQQYRCELNDHIRRVVVIYQHPQNPVPGEVKYFKDTEGGTEKTLWQAQATAGYCEKKTEEFIEKLQGWDWQCKLELTAQQ